MRKPYFLCLAVLVLWGVVSGNIIIGIITGLILELSHLVKKKADFTKETYTRISDLTSVIFIASIFLFYFNNEPFQVLPLLAKWLPMIFYLLIFSQMYSTKNYVIIGTRIGKQHYTHQPMNIILPYVLLTLFSTAVLNYRSFFYYTAVFIITSWVMLLIRNVRYNIFVNVAVIFVLFIAGYIGQKNMVVWYENMRNGMRMNYNNSFIEKIMRERMGMIPFEGVTSLGDVGELKLSGNY